MCCGNVSTEPLPSNGYTRHNSFNTFYKTGFVTFRCFIHQQHVSRISSMLYLHFSLQGLWTPCHRMWYRAVWQNITRVLERRIVSNFKVKRKPRKRNLTLARLYLLTASCLFLVSFFNPEGESSKFLRNLAKLIADYAEKLTWKYLSCSGYFILQ
jgi:hypothetical protein